LESLKNSSRAWLVELLHAFNSGNITKFEKMKPQWSVIPDLVAEERKLRQKISLLCLMEVRVFAKMFQILILKQLIFF